MELAKLPDNIFSMSKKDIHRKVKNILSESKGKTFDPLNVYVATKRAIEFFTAIQDNVKEKALEVAQKYGAESLVKFDAKIDVGSVYTQYDYSTCEDEEYDELVKMKKELEGKLKEREKFLKTLTKPHTTVTEDGVVNTIYPPLIKKTDGLRITY